MILLTLIFKVHMLMHMSQEWAIEKRRPPSLVSRREKKKSASKTSEPSILRPIDWTLLNSVAKRVIQSLCNLRQSVIKLTVISVLTTRKKVSFVVKWSVLASLYLSIFIMALPVMEFQDQGYRIRKICIKINTPKWNWTKVDYFDFSWKKLKN